MTFPSTSFIVVFGSAPVYVQRDMTRLPRDIDVAFGGDFSEHDAEQAVRVWAQKNTLPGDLPVDAHRVWVYPGRELVLPTAPKVVGTCVVLAGDVKVVFEETTFLSSALRAAEFDTGAAFGVLGDRLRHGGLEIGFEACSDDPGIGGRVDDSGHTGGKYSGSGPQALVNALRHAPDQFIGELGELGELLAWIKGLGCDWLHVAKMANRELGGMHTYEVRASLSADKRGKWRLVTITDPQTLASRTMSCGEFLVWLKELSAES